MTDKARELLERTAEILELLFEGPNDVDPNTLAMLGDTRLDEIRAYLSVEPEAEPVAWGPDSKLLAWIMVAANWYIVSLDNLHKFEYTETEQGRYARGVNGFIDWLQTEGRSISITECPPPRPAEKEAKPIGYVVQYSDGILGSDIYYTPEEAVDYTEGDGLGIPVYRHPPKSVARPIGYADKYELEEFRSGNYGNFSVQCKEKCEDAVAVFIEPSARKPMTEEETVSTLLPTMSDDYEAGFIAGIRFAEKHHGIEKDVREETPD